MLRQTYTFIFFKLWTKPNSVSARHALFNAHMANALIVFCQIMVYFDWICYPYIELPGLPAWRLDHMVCCTKEPPEAGPSPRKLGFPTSLHQPAALNYIPGATLIICFGWWETTLYIALT